MLRLSLPFLLLFCITNFQVYGQSKETIMIGDDSLIINNDSYENHEENLKILEGDIGMIKTQAICRPDDRDYYFIFGFLKKVSEQEYDGNSIILLCKNDRILDSLIIDLNPGYNMMYGFLNPKNLSLNPTADAYISNYARGSCGAAIFDILFFVKDQKFIYGLKTRSQGDIESEFTSESIVTKHKIPENEIWVDLKFGDTFEDKRTEYFTHIKKYQWDGKTLNHLNPITPQYYYVTSSSGVKERNTPYTTGHSERIHPHGSRLKVLHKTSLEMTITDEHGNRIKNNWYQIESSTEDGYVYQAYVFGAFLSTENPYQP